MSVDLKHRRRSHDENDWLLADENHHPRMARYTWVGVASAAVSVGTSIYSANQQKKAASKALDAQRSIAENLKYEPIDIDRLKREATATAIENATRSLALERELNPEVAAVRAEVPRQVMADLQKDFTRLPTDTVNQVQRAGRVIGAKSGGPESAVPITAGLLGLNSIDYFNQQHAAALNRASDLLNQNPLAPTGLDPGTIANLEVANNAANNQFNLEKSGVNSNLANSEAAARTAQIGGQVGIASSITSALPTMIGAFNRPSQPSSYADLLKKIAPTSNTVLNQNPATNPLMSTGGSALGLV